MSEDVDLQVSRETLRAEVREAVQRGMEFLDQHFPGHELRVNLGILDVDSSMVCPLAQASGKDYLVARFNLHERASEHMPRGSLLGFVCTWETRSLLNEAWCEAYQARRATADATTS